MRLLNKQYLQIGPFNWKIQRGTPQVHTDSDSDSDSEELVGLTDYNSLTITISDDPRYSPQIIREAFIHEILHAVIYTTPHHHTLSYEEEETLIQSISPLLTQALIQLSGES